MKVKQDAAYRAYISGLEGTEAVRIKDVREQPVVVGGRTTIRMFVGEGDRGHPRMLTAMPPATDANPPALEFDPATIPTNVDELRAALTQVLGKHRKALDPEALRGLPEEGRRYARNSIIAQRRLQFFANARSALAAWVKARKFPRNQQAAGLRAIRELEDASFMGVIEFDDEDTDTYHSYNHDAAFVHYLEQMLAGLPLDGTPAMAVLSPASQESVRRQRAQATAHLDAIMRSKYVFEPALDERDVEQGVGALLIDRETRMIASVVPAGDPLVPEYEVLRVDPASRHRHAGAWIYRDGDTLRLQDGTKVSVDDDLVRSAKRDAEQLTFMRAPKDKRLRQDVALDWDGDGIVSTEPIEWVSWAGHCDVKGVMEALGLALREQPTLSEYRADTGATETYDRSLLLEMVASVIELGSDYRSLDGTDEGQTGESWFGGARNDSRSDQLAFATKTGRAFTWPPRSRGDAFEVVGLQLDGTKVRDLDGAFGRFLPDLAKVDFADNPRFVRTRDGDANEIDVTDGVIQAEIDLYQLDRTGEIERVRKRITLDLRAGAKGPEDGMFLLGSQVADAGERRITKVFYDPRDRSIVKRDEWAEHSGRRVRVRISADEHRVALAAKRNVTLMREARYDDPGMYQTLLDHALRKGQPICADTDERAPVWNGMVTRLEVERVAINDAAGVEQWRITIDARFGQAQLEYLMRRGDDGEPAAWCPVRRANAQLGWPDFLWQDLPDIASKALVDGRWMVNTTMFDRGMITVERDRSVEGGFYVHDDHVKNVFELVWCTLSGHHWTIIHDGKRHGFTDKRAWTDARKELERLRKALAFAE